MGAAASDRGPYDMQHEVHYMPLKTARSWGPIAMCEWHIGTCNSRGHLVTISPGSYGQESKVAESL